MQQKAYLNFFKWYIGGLLENTSVVHRLWGKAEAQTWGSCRCLKAQALVELSLALISLLHPLAADSLHVVLVSYQLATIFLCHFSGRK